MSINVIGQRTQSFFILSISFAIEKFFDRPWHNAIRYAFLHKVIIFNSLQCSRFKHDV